MRVIAIAGGTASGKTTLSNNIISTLRNRNIKVDCFALDSFYKINSLSFDERKKLNYDHPNAFDIDLLISCYNSLVKNKRVELPVYDFSEHKRSETKVDVIEEELDVLIIEGILTLHFEQIRNISDVKIFVDTNDKIRLERKLIRDVNERGRTREYALAQWDVFSQPSYELYCLGSKKYADSLFFGEEWKQQDIENLLSQFSIL